MQIKPLRSMVGAYGKVKKGVIATVPDHIAKQLIKRGVAVPIQAVEGGGKALPRPPKRSRSGGRTGGAKQSSSSAADQAQKDTTTKD